MKEEKHIHECLILKRLRGVSVCLVILLLFSSSTGGGEFFGDINQNDFFTDTDAGDDYPEKDVQSVEPSHSKPSDFDPFAGHSSSDALFDETESEVTSFTSLEIKEQREIIKKAVFNLMDYHLPNLVEKKAVRLGNKDAFGRYIEKIGETRELGIGEKALAKVRKSFFRPHYILWIESIEQLIPRLTSGQKNIIQMDCERSLWHESMHIFEFEHPELDEPFKRHYGHDSNFDERHAHYYESLVANLWGAEDRLNNNGQLDQSGLSGVKKVFAENKKEYWKEWSTRDQEDDLRLFYDMTGVYLSWSLFESKFEPLPKTTESYAIGIKSGRGCRRFHITDRGATSNVKVTPFLKSMDIDANTYGERVQDFEIRGGTIRKITVYMTSKHFVDLRSYKPEDLCIMRSYLYD